MRPWMPLRSLRSSRLFQWSHQVSERLKDTPDAYCGNASIISARLLYGTCADCDALRSVGAVVAQMLLSLSAVYESVLSFRHTHVAARAVQ